MTIPVEYQRATDHFHQFLCDARDAANLETVNQAYTMTQGVLLAFRRRLPVPDAIRFANALPADIRALFVADWDLDEPLRPFEDRDEMTREVQSLRPQHNWAPDSSIRDVARALRRNVDESALDRALATLNEGAQQFWEIAEASDCSPLIELPTSS
jgi:uncharacterized protein (DUF2267 family)